MALDEATNPMQGVSGPGDKSKRTDLQYQAPEYGGGVAYDATKSGATLASTPDVRGATNTEVRQAASNVSGQSSTPVTSLYAPSDRPNEPITHGVNVGDGGGANALRMTSQFASVKLSDTLAKMLPYDTTGEIGILYQQAQARGM
jgi:hypothetical protein